MGLTRRTFTGLVIGAAPSLLFGQGKGKPSALSVMALAVPSLGDAPLTVTLTDFHLQTASPCIDAGVGVGLTTDYEGNPIH